MSIYDEIRTERIEQDKKWGGPAHDDHHTPLDWIGFIVRHAARALGGTVEVLDEGHWWTAKLTVDGNGETRGLYRAQLVRVAALAVAAIEAFDRRRGAQGQR